MSDRVLVIGGSGFIGTHLCRGLREAGYEPVVYDRVVPRDTGVEFHQGDMASLADLWPALLNGVRAVFHLAWTTKPQSANDSPLYDLQTNVVSSVHLLDGVVRLGHRPRVIFVSTGGAIYGPTSATLVAEDHPTYPINAYGVTKLAFEHYLRLYRHLYGLDYLVFRPSNPYGELQDPLGAQGAVGVFLGRIAQDREITIWGDGSVVRDYFYVGDLVAAMLLALQPRADLPSPPVFNIGSGEGLSLLELIAAMERITGRKARVGFTPARKADSPRIVLDTARVTRHLGWRPVVGLDDGLRRTWEWVRGS